MKAIICANYGPPDGLKLKEVDRPAPKDHEVLVKVHAASVNSWDWELLHGTPFANRAMFGLFKPRKINILGCDIAGRVEAVGKSVTLFKPGDEVFGDLSAGGWGGFAEFLCADENAFTLKPSNMTFAEAAATPQAALLALQGLRLGQLCAGQKVLINGAGGGMGSFAIQIAKSLGAGVTGVDSTGKLDLMRSLGADSVIDYTREDFTRSGQRYDLILDAQAHHTFFDYQRALKPGGVFVFVGGSIALAFLLLLLGPLISRLSNKKMLILLHKPNIGLVEINEFYAAGKVKPIIDKRFSLSEVPAALRYFGEGKCKGKIVISMEENQSN